MDKTYQPFLPQLPRALLQSSLTAADKILRRIKSLLYKLTSSPADKEIFLSGAPTESRIFQAGPRPGLTPAELAEFENKGWTGPFPFLTPRGVAMADRVYYRVHKNFSWPDTTNIHDPDAFAQRPWAKSVHGHVRECFDIASHPLIVERVASLLGPDIMAWGFSINVYRPGRIHPWHVDLEHRRWHGVTVFLALKNVSPAATLKVVNGSHRLEGCEEEMESWNDEELQKEAYARDPNAHRVAIPLREGEFFLFQGKLWHGSKNESLLTRSAMILQYSRPDQKAAIPKNYHQPVQWHPSSPLCVMVKGEDRWGVNPMASRPGMKDP